jgi:hypothetical protein
MTAALRLGIYHVLRLLVTVILSASIIFALTSGTASAHPLSKMGTHAALVTSSPVLFVHGFNGSASIPGGCNGSTTWGSAKAYLTSHGYTGQLITIGFYNGDTSCDVNLKDRQDSHCNNYFAGNTGTTSEDQRHIACTLDWYIWNTFTQYGQNVELVAHSMGGTIVRWAVYAAGSSSLPPYVYVRDAVTMASPHNGIPWGGSITCGICLQLAELQPGSSFLSDLQNKAQNPQASGGTNWTIFGSSCESWTNGGVDASSEMAMSAQHKVLYLSPPCYHHGDYLTDQSDSLDAYANYCNNACSGAPSNATGYSTTFPRALHEMELAISN